MIYTFKCNDCSGEIDIKLSPKENTLKRECPTCGTNMERVWNSIGIHFKGSGFYVTDNSSAGKSTV